jgi:hypothetical protein
MSEDDAPEQEQEAPDASVAESAPPQLRHRRRWPWVLAAALLTPIVLLFVWIQITLHYTYSSGYRTGYVQKLSEKGWVCKTWEGELAMVNVPGAMQERWQFSVRDDSIARLIEKSQGSRVTLTYSQHKGVPTSCFGETEYYVTDVRVLGQ